MTAEQEPREAKETEAEGRHEPRFLVYVVMKVELLRADGVLANDTIVRRLRAVFKSEDSPPPPGWKSIATGAELRIQTKVTDRFQNP
jgi:hypothetical protein